MYKNLKWIDEIKKHFLFLFMIAVFFMLLFRNFGMYPVVFADEYGYSLYSRILSFKDEAFPNYLYFIIFKETNYCGDGFLGCARILNSLFYVSAAPFIYSIARQVCTKKTACFIVLLALLSPVNSYTAYYMPESFYYFVFWMFTWFVLRLDATSKTRSWCLAGVLLGMVSLVKPHGLLLFPMAILYIFYIKRQYDKPWIGQAWISISFFIASALLVKFFVGYIVAGKSGLTFFGVTYTSMAASATSNMKHYMDLLSLALINIKGHVLVIVILFGVSIAAALSSLKHDGEIIFSQKISCYTLGLLFTLIPLIGLFAASTVNYGPYESIGRLSIRYYNFAFPLLFIVAASQFSISPQTGSIKYRVVLAFIMGAILIYAVLSRFRFYVPSYVDGPELASLLDARVLYYGMGILSLSALMLWIYAPSKGAKLFLYYMMPIFIIYSTYYIHQQFRRNLEPTVFDKAGMFTRFYLPSEERSKVLIVGTHMAGLYRSLFYLDNAKASCETIAEQGKYDFSKTPKDKEWVLVIGNDAPNTKFTQIAMGGYTLVHVINATLPEGAA